MLTNLLKTAIARSAQNPWRVLAVSAVLAVLALIYTTQAFDMTTDTGDLISAKTGWRRSLSESSAWADASESGSSTTETVGLSR